MPDELFSGIPSLDDEAGVQNYLNNAILNEAGFSNEPAQATLQTPIAAQPAQAQAQPVAEEGVPANNTAPQYTSEQIAAIIARNQQLEAYTQRQQQQPQVQPQTQTQSQSQYTPRQAQLIKQLIDKGVPLEKINAALANRQAPQANTALMNRLANVENYLRNQEYAAAQSAFVDKMTAFGERFGLSENDLVTFGNKAMTMGINLTEVPAEAVESVFRAVYPDQYAIRSQRIAGASASHIYGGASAIDTPRASASKLEDAYVDAFLKQSMPNQYGKYTK